MPEVIFNGPEGRLEGRYHQSKGATPPIALMLHPHPQHGGTMNNRVTYQLFHIFVNRGFSVLRFNFRGVGRSQGRYDDGQGELSDAAAALDWLQANNPDAPQCWVGGYSFGAWIGMQLLMRRPEITGFISVSPPANFYDFAFLAPCPTSGLIVQGDQDEIATEPAVAALANRLAHQRHIQVDYKVIRGATHFFHDKMEEMSKAIESYLTKTMAARAKATAET
jgi:alpha/beta superfamily hydrolase